MFCEDAGFLCFLSFVHSLSFFIQSFRWITTVEYRSRVSAKKVVITLTIIELEVHIIQELRPLLPPPLDDTPTYFVTDGYFPFTSARKIHENQDQPNDNAGSDLKSYNVTESF